jgi:uncharacterized SAM-binding protein YcdF (DUF218 family)
MNTLRRPWARRLIKLLLVVAVPVGLYLCRGWLLPPVGRYLDVSEPPVAVDYVMVLGGGDDTRPFVAAALVKSGLAKKVLVPSIQRSAENEAGVGGPPEEIIRGVLLARGVPADAIVLLPGESSSTLDESRALAQFLDSQPDCSVALVTNPPHTRRARSIFRKALGERAGRLHMVAAPSDGYDDGNWWQTEEGFGRYIDEYVKLVFYGLAY